MKITNLIFAAMFFTLAFQVQLTGQKWDYQYVYVDVENFAATQNTSIVKDDYAITALFYDGKSNIGQERYIIQHRIGANSKNANIIDYQCTRGGKSYVISIGDKIRNDPRGRMWNSVFIHHSDKYYIY
jgi:hypothetical protein